MRITAKPLFLKRITLPLCSLLLLACEPHFSDFTTPVSFEYTINLPQLDTGDYAYTISADFLPIRATLVQKEVSLNEVKSIRLKSAELIELNKAVLDTNYYKTNFTNMRLFSIIDNELMGTGSISSAKSDTLRFAVSNLNLATLAKKDSVFVGFAIRVDSAFSNPKNFSLKLQFDAKNKP